MKNEWWALCLVSCLLTAAVAPAAQRKLAPSARMPPRSAAFGAKIIDLAFTVDPSAQASLTANPDSDAPARMIVTDARGADTAYDVLIRIKGQKGSRRPFDDKPAFKVKLAHGARLLGLEHLTLNNMVQDPTMLHEALAYQVYDAMGVKVPGAGYARLKVNGQSYGLYLNLESPDAHFLQRRFGDHSGILYEGAYGVDLRSGDAPKFQLHEGVDAHHASLETLIGALEAPGDAVFYGGSALVDVESFLHMMAAGVLLDDWDNYAASNNYRIYWSPAARRWFFIPTGLDQTFSGESTGLFSAKGLLFQKCLASKRCTQDYLDAVRDTADRFERLDLTAKMDALLALIDTASQSDSKKPYDAASMKSARSQMRGFIAKRPNDIRAALSSCPDGARDAAVDCAGFVVVHVRSNQCIEVVSRSAAANAGRARLSECHGGSRQRWHLVAKGEAFELAVDGNNNCLGVTAGTAPQFPPLEQSACTGAPAQLFTFRSLTGDTTIETHSDKCVAVSATSAAGAVSLVELPCNQDTQQTWRMQRSIYK